MLKVSPTRTTVHACILTSLTRYIVHMPHVKVAMLERPRGVRGSGLHYIFTEQPMYEVVANAISGGGRDTGVGAGPISPHASPHCASGQLAQQQSLCVASWQSPRNSHCRFTPPPHTTPKPTKDPPPCNTPTFGVRVSPQRATCPAHARGMQRCSCPSFAPPSYR